jgi:hypothetical protein
MALLLLESVGHGCDCYTADLEGDGVEGVAVCTHEGEGVGTGGGIPGEEGRASAGSPTLVFCA